MRERPKEVAGTAPPLVEGLRALAGRYELFLLDQFGVLHDGRAPYPGVREALAELRRLGKRRCVISNSGRTAAENSARMARLGLDGALLDAVVTSGDAAIAWLVAEAPEARCFPVCTGDDVSPLVEAGVHLVERVEEAELIFLGGMPGPIDEISLEAMEPWIAEGLRRGLPMLCANPDRRGPYGDRVVLSPGAVAELYAERGGEVRLFGKPDAAIFRHALGLFPEVPPARCLMIGDMPETDLVGAAAVGVDGAWVIDGVYAGETARGAEPETRRRKAEAILERDGARAHWLLYSLAW